MLIDYHPVRTARKFHVDRSFVRGIMGPIGSGKSVACCMEILLRALQQAPGRDGVRRSRWAIVRNTATSIESTTYKTCRDWIRPEFCRYQGRPKTGHAQFPHVDGKTWVDLELLFIGLDRPDDVQKIFSLELTGAWINEAKWLPKMIIDALRGRLGRYPREADGGPSWTGLIMDTNPPPEDHWWYQFAELGEWRGRGVDEYSLDYGKMLYWLEYFGLGTEESKTQARQIIKDLKTVASKFDIGTWQFFRQPGALVKAPDGTWIPNVHGENVENHKLGYLYWLQALPGNSPEWIRVYIEGQYGSVFDGKPVYETVFRDDWHVAKKQLEVYRNIPLRLGWDWGNTPAVSIAQLSPKGQYRNLREFLCEGGGLRKFVETVVRPALQNEFHGLPVLSVGDPSGAAKDQRQGLSCLDEMESLGIPTLEAPTNDLEQRIEAVRNLLSTAYDGEPGYLADPRCARLISGFRGGYHYPRVQASGGMRWHQNPEKNEYSHIHDALQYDAVALKGVKRREERRRGRGEPVGVKFGGGVNEWEAYT